MEFDWKPIAGAVIKAGAPVIGGALLGPMGASVGGLLGGILANALGVEPTPEAVGNAIATQDPGVVKAAMASADSEAVAKWEAITSIAHDMAEVDKINISQVNETIRSETAAGVSFWHWRHLIGYMVLIWFAIPIPAFIRLTFQYDSGAAMQLTAMITACIPLYGFMAGLLGYVAQDTTKLKSIAMTGEQPTSGAASIAKAIVPKKK